MSAKISTISGDATISHYNWTSENEALAAYLNSLLPENGPSGADPNPDLTAAQQAVDLLRGAEIVSFDKMTSEPGVVY